MKRFEVYHMDTLPGGAGIPGQKKVHVCYIDAPDHRDAFRQLKELDGYEPHWQLNPNAL